MTMASFEVEREMDPENINDSIKADWELKQKELKSKLVCDNVELWQQEEEEFSGLNYIGGVDLSFVKADDVNACACLVVCSYPNLEVVYSDCFHVQLMAPYISGFLAFREVGFIIDRIDKLRKEKPEYLPQVIFVDGNGTLHPREFGIACHLGVLTNMVTIGVAKKLLHVDGIEKDASLAEKIKQLEKGGDTFSLIGSSGKIHGKVLRVCDESTNPVYVSVGHKICLETAVRLVHRCSKYRIPEPIRQADMRSREFLRDMYNPQPAKKQRQKPKSNNVQRTITDISNAVGRIDDADLDGVMSIFDDS